MEILYTEAYAAELKRERDYWRSVAAYLASCHAATAEYDGQLSTVSKSRKARFAAICQKAAEAMTPGGFVPHNSTEPDKARERCEYAVKLLAAK